MSDQLYLRGTCELLYERETPDSVILVDKTLENFSFVVSKNGQDVKIRLLRDGKTIEFESVVRSLEQDILRLLRINDYKKFNAEEKERFRSVKLPIHEAVIHFVGMLRQELHRYNIKDGLIGNPRYEWSLDNKGWHFIDRGLTVSVGVSSLGNLNERMADHLQRLLLEGEEPLAATGYLHHARNSINRRFQWVYATIAAELAAKEILARMEPKLRVVLEELPSPPLHKLYGGVLQSVADVELSGSELEKLRQGAIKRNKLVHNPKSATPTFDEVTEYIDFIDDRVRWLLEQWRSMKS